MFHIVLPMVLRSVALALTVGIGVACGSTTVRPPEVDCGVYDAGYGRYDLAGRECFWNAYTAGRSVTWGVTQRTIEGDPIPSTITYDRTAGLTVTRDVRPDGFSSREDRRLWTWKCDGATPAADTTAEAFRLSGCRGDGTSSHYQTRTGFP